MKKFFAACTILSLLVLAGCTPVERQAYRAVVAAKAFLDKEKVVHPECPAETTSAVCQALARGTAAKDAVIDAAEVYCAGPNFESGGECDAPKKGTPGAEQAVAKLQAATANLNQTIADIKGVF